MQDKRYLRTAALAVLLAAIALAAVNTFNLGNPQSNTCAGYSKTHPGQTKPSFSAGSCADSPTNERVNIAAGGKGGPMVVQRADKTHECIAPDSKHVGASINGKRCKPGKSKNPVKVDRRGANTTDAQTNTTDVPDYILNPDNYEWPLEQQWFKISATTTSGQSAELWKDGYGFCMEVTAEGFFRQFTCDPNNPNQNWVIDYVPQPETPVAPVQPIVTPPPVLPPVLPPLRPGCPYRCPAGQIQDRETCECYCDDLCGPDEIQLDDCSCEKVDPCDPCPQGKIHMYDDCTCQCPNTCSDDEEQDPETCECIPMCSIECLPCQILDPVSCTCSCKRGCPPGLDQDPETCECSKRCTDTCLPCQVQDPFTCMCSCKHFCPHGQVQDPDSCDCYPDNESDITLVAPVASPSPIDLSPSPTDSL